MRQLEKFLKAVANRRRLAILKFLRDNQTASLVEMSREIDLAFRSTSKHLRVLLDAGLIERGQRSKYAEFRLNPQLPYRNLLREIFKRF